MPAPELQPLLDIIRQVLSTKTGPTALYPPDFIVIALAESSARSLSFDEVFGYLYRMGLPHGFNSEHNRQLILRLLPGDPRLVLARDRFQFAEGVDIASVLKGIISSGRFRVECAKLGVELPLFSRPRAKKAATSKEKAVDKAVAPKKSTSRKPSSKAAPATPELPPIPAAPERTQSGLAITTPALDAVRALSSRKVVDLSVLAHTLRAHALASAEQFEELLAFATLVGVEPHTYQLETVRRVLRQLRGRALLADEVGLGKTVEAMMTLREYQLRGMVRRVLILTPPALVAQWQGELAAKTGVEARSTLQLPADDGLERFWSEPGVIVASHALARMAKHAATVQAQKWDLVIVDEAHHVKNRRTLAWKLVDGLQSRFLLLLTATPVENDLEEVYNLVTLLKPGQLATAAEFRKQFVDPKDPTSPRNRDRLKQLLGEVMVRNTRAQSGLKLPPRYVTTVAIEPHEAERKLYEGVVDLVRAQHGDASSRLTSSTLLLQAGSSPNAVRKTLLKQLEEHRSDARAPQWRALSKIAQQVESTAKLKALLDIITGHREQVLVFSRFRETLHSLEAALKQSRIPFASLHGGLDSVRKREAIQAFERGTPVLLASDVGSEGQNLQFCHVLVNFDLPWNPMVIEQRIGRLHRFGQQSEVRVYNLCAKGTAEERLLDVLDRRVHLFELVVGEMDMILGNMADERDLEERILSLYSTSRSEEELATGFDAIADELAKARGQYEKVKALDSTLFGKDFEA